MSEVISYGVDEAVELKGGGQSVRTRHMMYSR